MQLEKTGLDQVYYLLRLRKIYREKGYILGRKTIKRGIKEGWIYQNPIFSKE